MSPWIHLHSSPPFTSNSAVIVSQPGALLFLRDFTSLIISPSDNKSAPGSDNSLHYPLSYSFLYLVGLGNIFVIF